MRMKLLSSDILGTLVTIQNKRNLQHFASENDMNVDKLQQNRGLCGAMLRQFSCPSIVNYYSTHANSMRLRDLNILQRRHSYDYTTKAREIYKMRVHSSSGFSKSPFSA